MGVNVGDLQATLSVDAGQAIADLKIVDRAMADVGAQVKLTQEQVQQLFSAGHSERARMLEDFEKAANGAKEASAATATWSDAQQRAAMAMSGMHEQALKLNEAFDHGRDSSGAFGEEMLKMVGLGAAVGGGMELAIKALELLKEATIGSVEQFVEFGHSIGLISEKLNIPVEMAAAWQQTESVTGVSAEKMTNSLAMMDQRLEEGNKRAVQAVRALGLSVGELEHAEPAKQIELLTEGLEHLKDSGGNAAVAIKELMGRGGLAMLPALTPEAALLRHEIEEINGPLEEQVKEAQLYQESMALLSAEVAKVRREIVEPLVGGLPAFVDLMTTRLSETEAIVARIVANPYFMTLVKIMTLPTTAPFRLIGAGIDLAELGVDGTSPLTKRRGISDKPDQMEMLGLPGDLQTLTAGLKTELSHVHAEIRKETAAHLAAQKKALHQYTLDIQGEFNRIAKAEGIPLNLSQELRQDAEKAHLIGAQEAADKKYWADIDKQVAASVVADVKERTRVEVEGYKASIAGMRGHIETMKAYAGAFSTLGSAIGGSFGTALSGLGGVFDGLATHTQEALDLDRRYQEVLKTTASEAAADAARSQLELAQNIQKVAVAAATAIGIWKQYSHDLNATSATIGGAAQGAATGAQVGGAWGALVGGIAGGLIGFFSGQTFRHIMHDAGSVMGVEMTDALAKSISAIRTKFSEHDPQTGMALFNLSPQGAGLLALDQAMAGSLKKAHEFAPQVIALIAGIAAGALPVTEALDQINKAFVAMETEAGPGRVTQEMLGIMAAAKAAHIELQAVTDFVKGLATDAAPALAAAWRALAASGTTLGFTQDQITEKLKRYEEELKKSGLTEDEVRLKVQQRGRELDKTRVATDETMKRMDVLARLTAADFAAMMAAGMSLVDIFDKLGPTIDAAVDAYNRMGVALPAILANIVQLRQFVAENKDLADTIAGLPAIIHLAVAGFGDVTDAISLLMSSFHDMEKWLVDHGMPAAQAHAMALYATRDAARELQYAIDHGLIPSVDEATQAWLDEQKAAGNLDPTPQDRMATAAEHMVELLALLVTHFGVTLPKAIQDYINSLNNIPKNITTNVNLNVPNPNGGNNGLNYDGTTDNDGDPTTGNYMRTGGLIRYLPHDATVHLHKGERLEVTPADKAAARNAADSSEGGLQRIEIPVVIAGREFDRLLLQRNRAGFFERV